MLPPDTPSTVLTLLYSTSYYQVLHQSAPRHFARHLTYPNHPLLLARLTTNYSIGSPSSRWLFKAHQRLRLCCSCDFLSFCDPTQYACVTRHGFSPSPAWYDWSWLLKRSPTLIGCNFCIGRFFVHRIRPVSSWYVIFISLSRWWWVSWAVPYI